MACLSPPGRARAHAHYKRPIIQINGDVNFARRTNAEALIYYNKNINQMLIVFDLLNDIFKYLCACVFVSLCMLTLDGCRKLGVKYTTRTNGNFCLSITASKCRFKLNCLHQWGAYKYFTMPSQIHRTFCSMYNVIRLHSISMPSHPLKAKKTHILSTVVLISIPIHTKPILIFV